MESTGTRCHVITIPSWLKIGSIVDTVKPLIFHEII